MSIQYYRQAGSCRLPLLYSELVLIISGHKVLQEMNKVIQVPAYVYKNVDKELALCNRKTQLENWDSSSRIQTKQDPS